MSAVTPLLALALVAALASEPPAPPVSPAPGSSRVDPVETTEASPEKPRRPEDKTLVASLDVEQGAGKERLSLYRDGTLVLVKTYEGVRKVKKKVLSEEEVDIIRRVCREAMSLDVAEYHVDVLGRAEPRRFRIEVGRDGRASAGLPVRRAGARTARPRSRTGSPRGTAGPFRRDDGLAGRPLGSRRRCAAETS